MKSVLRILVFSSLALFQNGVLFAQWTGGTQPSWTQLDTLRKDKILSIAVAPNGYIFVGTKDHGLWRSTDNGASWAQKLSPPSVYEIWSITFDRSGNIYAGTHFVGVHRSTDNGNSWSQLISSGNTDYFSVAVTDSGYVLAADGTSSEPINRSTDNGSTWSFSWGATYVGALATNAAFSPVTCIVYAGSGLGHVWLSTNEGASWLWTDAGKLGAGGNVCGFVVTSISQVYAAASTGGVFVSGDGGQTWSPRNTGLSTYFSGYSNYIYCMANDYASTTQPFLLLGTCKGMYWSDNAGGNWNPGGLDSMYVLAIAGSASGNMLAGTDGYGLWYTGDTPTRVGMSSDPVPTQYALAQNYPNPFNPSTTIRYALPQRSQVRLSIIDALGREVAVLANSEQVAGTKEAVFNASGLASGIYFYRLQAGSFVQTKKLVLLK